MDNRQAPIMIQNQYIKDLSMEIPHAPVIFKRMQDVNPQVAIDVNVEAHKLEEDKTLENELVVKNLDKTSEVNLENILKS